MAQQRANPSSSDDPAGAAKPADSATSLEEKGADDSLLAQTDEGWDMDDQLRDLQAAAGAPAPPPDLAPPAPETLPALPDEPPPAKTVKPPAKPAPKPAPARKPARPIADPLARESLTELLEQRIAAL